MAIDVTSLFDRRADNRWDRICVADLVERVTWSTPDKEAVVGWEGAWADARYARLTYAALDALANRVAGGLLARGLQRGDRAVLVVENSVEAYAFALGASKIGVVVSPLNPALAVDVVEHLLRRLAPSFAVVDAELWARVAGAFDAAGVAPSVTIEIGGGVIDGTVGFTEFAEAPSSVEPEATIHGDDIWEILFTSGTTAMPKGVMLSHTSSTMSAHGFALTLTRGIHPETDLRLVSFLPTIYHIGHAIFGLSVHATGGTLVLGRRPSGAAIAEAVERERATALWAGSPIMVAGLLAEVEATPRDLSTLSVLVYGWAEVAPAVYDGLRRHAPGLRMVEIFGQTEAIACHRFWPDQHEQLFREIAPQVNVVGLPSPLLASRLVDAFGDPLDGQVGVPGEAVYRTPTLTAGYYLDEEATRTAFEGGWFHSGDSCADDESGQRVMVDRFKDIVKSGGENVSTIRVESVLTLHPGVAKAAVIGLADERWGERVTAIVIPKEPGGVSEHELIAFARERLAGYETPKQVVLVDALPETVGGKVLKYRLRQQYAALQGGHGGSA
ncbi:MAG: AMP-binding protein [Lapillicoccus sp.]